MGEGRRVNAHWLLDEPRRSEYLCAMLRKLLALLVLVTGLAAVGTPAQARVFDVESVRTVDAGYACTAQAGTRSARLAGVLRKDRDEAQPKACPRPPKVVLIVPTVMLQADRARE
jgi:hypothetical protein